MYYDEFMKIALEEAKTSLKEGNNCRPAASY